MSFKFSQAAKLKEFIFLNRTTIGGLSDLLVTPCNQLNKYTGVHACTLLIIIIVVVVVVVVVVVLNENRASRGFSMKPKPC